MNAKDLEAISTWSAKCKNNPVKFVQEGFEWGSGELKKSTGPDEWQIMILGLIRDGLLTIEDAIRIAVASGHGIGKAQSKTLKLHTPDGLKTWGDIKKGDYVFGADGNPTKVIAIHEQGIKDIYRITFDDSSSTLCCADHIWTVRGRNQRRVDSSINGASYEWIEKTTGEILTEGVKRPNGVSLVRQWEIPQQGIVEFKQQEVPVAPYVIGTWLGDGGRTRTCITSNDSEVTERIRSLGYTVNQGSKQGTTALTCYILGIKAHLRELGILDKYSYEKSVPKIYMENTSEIRAEVLRGLLDTDGEVTKNNSIGFSSCSKQLADDVVWLARSLGGKARIQPTIKKPTYRNSENELVNGKDCYRVTLTMPDRFQSFYIARKQERISNVQQRYLTRWIDNIELVGKDDCMCITVSNKDGLYLTNDFIVTHNSALVAWIILWAISTMVDTKGVVTANTENQLKLKTWAELAKWHRLCVTKELFHCTATALFSIDVAHEKTWRIDMVPWSANNTEAFAGLHNQGRRILLVFDEASAIDDSIWEVTEGALTDGDTQIIWVAFGNPTRNTGRFKGCFGQYRKRWKHFNIDSRTVKISNKKQIAEWVEDYGEDSDFVKVRVRGMFPNNSAKQFISIADADAAYGRFLKPEQYNFAPKILTCDPAAEGDDNLEIGIRQGLHFRILRTIPYNDNDVQIANIIANYEDEEQADGVILDGGYGTGIKSVGRTLGRNWMIVMFGEKSPDPGCLNMRAYMWKCVKEWLKEGGSIPKMQDLYDDLIGPETVARLDGKIQLESKKDMKKRGIPSPGKADALAISFAYPIQKKGSHKANMIVDDKSGLIFANTKYNPIGKRR